jgi:glycosyltransferase involved in cell wall biosynthesis
MNQLPGPREIADSEPTSIAADLRFDDSIIGSAFFAVCLPPPVHGQSLVNASVVDAALKFGGPAKIEIFDIGPGPHGVGFNYHMTRMARVVLAALTLARRGAKKDRQFYTVFESGFGIAYNFLLIGIARVLGYKVILHHHTSKHTLSRQRRFALLGRLAGSSSVNVVLSEEMADNMRRLYPSASNIMVSQNACHIPDNDAGTPARLRSNALRVGYLSNLSKEKGLNIVLEGASKCRDRGLALTFVFAGPAAGAEAAKDLALGRVRLGDSIEVIGPVRDAAKEAFFKSIDVFLFPTRYRYEAQPLVILEAISYGLPVITTNCGYVEELVGRQGIVLDVDGALADAIVGELEKLVTTQEYARWTPGEIKSYFRRLRATAFGQLRELMEVLFSVERDDEVGRAPAP